MSRVKMLKQATLHPPYPRRYLTHPPYACQNRRLTHWTCPLPGFALGSKKILNVPRGRAGLGRLLVGRVKCRYASGFFSPAALLDDLFEHSGINRLSAA